MKKSISKIVASIALIAIVLSLLWTWLLIIFSSPVSNDYGDNGISLEELQKLAGSGADSPDWFKEYPNLWSGTLEDLVDSLSGSEEKN